MTLLYEYGYLYLMKKMGVCMKNGKMKIYSIWIVGNFINLNMVWTAFIIKMFT